MLSGKGCFTQKLGDVVKDLLLLSMLPSSLTSSQSEVKESEVEESGVKMIQEEKPPPDQTPSYKKMTIVMHVIIFLYAAAFWIQTGVLPVSV